MIARISRQQVIIGMALLKLIIHLLANNIYGLHRDEYLYIAEGQHLGWGYMEGPPTIALLAWLADLFGGSPFMIRLLPTLIGVASMVLLGKMVELLGGKRWAVFLACLAFLISPAFLRSNMLFQPVGFNQFFWVLSAFWIIRIAQKGDPRDWYYLGITAGMGLMTKYSIAFFLIPILIASFFSEQRKWYATQHPYLAFGLALLIFLPNMIWQLQHNLPVVHHMRELAETQLVHVDPLFFILEQFQNQLAGSLVWIAGLGYLLVSRRIRQYRFLGIAFILMLSVILMLGGKTYYTLGAYPVLFVFGGLAMEELIKKKWILWCVAAGMFLMNVVFSPYALPFLPVDKMQDYCAFMQDKIGLDGPLRWEDGAIYTLPQDYADMFGWHEIVHKVSAIYHALPDSTKAHCHILGGSYAHAGAVNYYRKKYDLPEAHSLSASFLIWAPEKLKFNNQIMIDDRRQDGSSWFQSMTLVDSIENPYARDPGFIYYRSGPKIDVEKAWRDLVWERKTQYNLQ